LPVEETSNENANFVEEGESNNVLGLEDIVADPALRKPIEEMHPNIRDDAKREYVMVGPCQPKGHAYPKRKICGRNRSFHDKWFTNRPWLEYSVSKDAAFCFYCYLFKPLRVDNYGKMDHNYLMLMVIPLLTIRQERIMNVTKISGKVYHM
jgi:hypothetical protein